MKMNQTLTITPDELAKAFEEWDRRVRENPESFLSPNQVILQETPETMGAKNAAYIIGILRDTGAI